MEEARQPLFTTKPELERSGWDLQLWKISWMKLRLIHSQVKEPRFRLKKHLTKSKSYAIKETCRWMWRLKKIKESTVFKRS